MSLFIFFSFLEGGIDSCSRLEEMFSGSLLVRTSGWCWGYHCGLSSESQTERNDHKLFTRKRGQCWEDHQRQMVTGGWWYCHHRYLLCIQVAAGVGTIEERQDITSWSTEEEQMRAALYARMSNEEQVEGCGIDAELRDCRNFASEKGWPIVAKYVDEGKSARGEDITKRPRFKAMLEAAKNREFDILIVHKLDRFSRNLVLTLKCFDELSKTGTTFICMTEQIEYASPMGRVFLAMSGAFAQFYSDNLSQETKKGWLSLREGQLRSPLS
jgi:predicted site-specific integrase-resolvase